jgi:C_GCAxxG_C_C family probable redox protein
MLLAYGLEFGLSEDLAVHLGTGFGGGMARQGEVCGAVSGAIMVLGLKYGMTNETEEEAGSKTYELVSEFMNKFEEQKSTVRCKDLLGCDINTAEGREEAMEKDLFNALCPELVQTAGKILDDLID